METEHQNPALKYCVSIEQKKFLISYLNSFADTFRKRYGYVDLSNLYNYNAPIYFEKCIDLCSGSSLDDCFFEKLELAYRKKLLTNNCDTEIVKKNINKYFLTDLILNIGKSNPKENEQKIELSFLKYNDSFFLLEKAKYKINDIKIILSSSTEKEEKFSHQENFYNLIENLYSDFIFL